MINNLSNSVRVFSSTVLLALVIIFIPDNRFLILISILELTFAVIWYLLNRRKFLYDLLLTKYWKLMATMDSIAISIGVYLTGLTSPLLVLFMGSVILSSLDRDGKGGKFAFLTSNLLYNLTYCLVFFGWIPYIDIFSQLHKVPSIPAWIVSSITLFLTTYVSRRATFSYFENVQLARDDAENEKNKSLQRISALKKYNQALNEITKNTAMSSMQLEESLQRIVDTCAREFNLSRVSIWIYSPGSRSLIRLVSNVDWDQQIEIFEKDYSDYFNYIREESFLIAPDVKTNEILKDFIQEYFIPDRVTSRLDVSIRLSGIIVGVLVLEELEKIHVWTSEEESFASSISILIATAFESERKVQAQILERKSKLAIQAANRLTVELIESPSLDASLMIIFDYIMNNFDVDILSLYFTDEITRRIAPYKVRGRNIDLKIYDLVENISVTLETKSIFAIALKRKKYLFIPRVNTLEINNAKEREFAQKLGMKSIIYLPVRVGKENLGMFVIYNIKSYLELDEEKLDTLSKLNYQIAGAIQKGKIIKAAEKAKVEIEKERLETEALNKLIKGLNEHRDIKIIMSKVATYVSERFEILNYALYVTSSDKTKLLYADGKFPDFLDETDAIKIRSYEIPINEGGHYIPFRTKRPFYIPNSKTQRNQKARTDFENFVLEKCNYDSYLMIPLLLQNEAIGILDFSTDNKLILSKEDISRLSILGEQLSGIIYSSNLYKEVQEARSIAEKERSNALAAQEIAVRQAMETDSLNSLIKSLNEDLNIHVIIRKIYEFIKLNFNIHYYGLSLVDHERKVMNPISMEVPSFVSSEDKVKISLSNTRITDVKGAHAFAFKAKKPFYVPRIRISGMTPEEKFIQEKFQFESLLIIPLILESEAIGFLDLYNVGKLVITKEEITRLSILGEQLAGIIYGSNLFKELEENTKTLNQTIKAIRSDLSMAKKIQENSLPNQSSIHDRLHIVSHYIPMSEVGGDFYDITKFGVNKQRIFIADATGHGVQGAMITMAIKGIYDSLKHYELEVGDLLGIMNNEFVERYLILNSFFTALFVEIDLSLGKISYASAGHPSALLLRENKLISLERTGKLVGFEKHYLYETKEIEFRPSDRLFMFTDGIFEEFNADKEEFGEERLKKIILSNSHLSMQNIVNQIFTDLDEFLGNQHKDDDITLLAAEILP
jgi:serine phosphatase RsbU (regulator of sigma subunit)